MENVGIDVSKAKLDVLWLRDPQRNKIKTRVFRNHAREMPALIRWLQEKTGAPPQAVRVVLESTSVYHETVAYALHEAGFVVIVANPKWVHHFAKSEGQTHKTDKQDSGVLARYGLEKGDRLSRWQPEPEEIRHLRGLLGRLRALEKDRDREQHRLEKALATTTPARVTASIRDMITALEAEIRRLKEDIDDHIDGHPHLKRERALLESIPAIGEASSRVLLCSYHSRTFRSARQWAAFVGLVPRHHQSGTSVDKPSRIGRGSAGLLRKTLYMSGVTAQTYTPEVRALKHRLAARGKAGLSIVVAAMRKLLHIAYGVLKHQQEYRPQTT
ncbi:IS110 family RNA-guided transposase [Alloalcanivorax xenomutans]|uniref:IS110 family transposase n=1 Tax=Alloalcanivorax xenomutans TaxID=1094342 RepID=UPI0003B8E3FB|nr:hypothetical protein Q668_21630 [Alcanivorax sp. PN-3]